MTAPHRPYDRLLRPISLGDALATPAADELFIEPSGHPKITISTTIEIDGYSLQVTFNDTSISDAVAILRRQTGRQRPAEPPRPRRRRTRPEPLQYTAVWSDLGDEPDERNASVVQLAQLLLGAGQAAGWSNALETARRHYDTI